MTWYICWKSDKPAHAQHNLWLKQPTKPGHATPHMLRNKLGIIRHSCHIAFNPSSQSTYKNNNLRFNQDAIIVIIIVGIILLEGWGTIHVPQPRESDPRYHGHVSQMCFDLGKAQSHGHAPSHSNCRPQYLWVCPHISIILWMLLPNHHDDERVLRRCLVCCKEHVLLELVAHNFSD
jgi:hypothetical protein